MTVSGPSANQKCIFPFVFGGTTNIKCAHDADGFWCSTKVDSNGNHIGGEGNWGICGPSCFKGKDIQSNVKEYRIYWVILYFTASIILN